MYTKLYIILVILFILLGIPKLVQAPIEPFIWHQTASRINDNVLNLVVACESGGDPNAYNPKDTDGFPKFGLLQFHLPTFLIWAEATGIEEPDVWSPEQQIQLYKYAANNGKLRSWGCFNKIFPASNNIR